MRNDLDANETRLLNLKYGLLVGSAGTGKTTTIRKILKANPNWGLLTATTGVAADNLGDGTQTLHSALVGAAPVEAFREAFRTGDLKKQIRKIGEHHERIVVDEVSMLPAEIFSLVYQACKEAGVGLILVGDFLQLPPIGEKGEPKAEWVFQSEYWTEFINNGLNIVRLTRNHRAGSDALFSLFLTLLREGRATDAENIMPAAGIHWDRRSCYVDENFAGTTLFYRKKNRKQMNDNASNNLRTPIHHYKAKKFCENPKDWDPEWDKVPEPTLRVGHRVMILRNKKQGPEFEYVNGSMGIVEETETNFIRVRLDKGKRLVKVDYAEKGNSWWETIQHDDGVKTWETYEKHPATTGVRYLPVELAYASTIHKAQGLTLDRVQICTDAPFTSKFGGTISGLFYVAMSRCKRGSDVYLTGVTSLKDVCFTDPALKEWI